MSALHLYMNKTIRFIIVLTMTTLALISCGSKTVTPAVTPALPLASPPAPLVKRYVSPTGSDSNPGTEAKPWQTMKKAFRSIEAGDTLYMRGGVYETCYRCGYFENSGTEEQPITVTNYPGEQVEIRTDVTIGIAHAPFFCWATGSNPTPSVDYIRIIGADVNGEKGIVLRGTGGDINKVPGVWIAGDCEHWEIAGLHILETGKGIFLRKYSNQTITSDSPNYHYIHDNRIEKYYSGEGIQVNGNYNIIENNQIYKVTNTINTDWACHHINLLGHHNVVRGNDLNAKGSTAGCVGVEFEWDIADYNLIENNRIEVHGWGTYGYYLYIAGGDNNVIRHNTITGTLDNWYRISNPAPDRIAWPCNELVDSKSFVPANDPAAPDYEYFYNPRNCFSEGNQIYDNVYTRQ